MAFFLPYVPLLLAFVSCPERPIDWSRERLLLLLLSKNKSWKYGWRTFFIVYSKLDFRYWGTLPCYQFTILFVEHNLLPLTFSAFSTRKVHAKEMWGYENFRIWTTFTIVPFWKNNNFFGIWVFLWLLHAIVEEYFLRRFPLEFHFCQNNLGFIRWTRGTMPKPLGPGWDRHGICQKRHLCKNIHGLG